MLDSALWLHQLRLKSPQSPHGPPRPLQPLNDEVDSSEYDPSLLLCFISEFTHRHAARALRPTLRSLNLGGGGQQSADAAAALAVAASSGRLSWVEIETTPLPRRGRRLERTFEGDRRGGD